MDSNLNTSGHCVQEISGYICERLHWSMLQIYLANIRWGPLIPNQSHYNLIQHDHNRLYINLFGESLPIEASNRWLFGVTPRLHYTAKKHCPSDKMLNRGAYSLWSLKNTNLPIGLWPSWPPNHPHICWLASSLCLLSTSKLMCGGCSDTLWLPSHHPGRCCTLVVDEEIPPLTL